MTYVKAKFGLRTRDSRPSDTGTRGHSDPMDVDVFNSLSSAKGKGLSSPRDGCFMCGGAHFQRDCNARKGTGKQSYGKGKQSKSWSKSEPSFSGKGKCKENKGKSKGKAKGKSKGTKSANQGATDSHKGKTSGAGLSGLQNSKSEARSDIQESAQTCRGTTVGMVTNGMMTGVPLEQTYDTSASSFSLGGLDVGATSCRRGLVGRRRTWTQELQ